MPRLRHLTFTLAALAPLAGLAHGASLDDNLSDLKESLAYGKTSLYLRYRYEEVRQDNPAGTPPVSKNAHANTLRFALGYETKPYYGFSAFGQYEGVFANFDKAYNSTTNGQTEYPQVVDPAGSELQQAFLKYAPKYLPRTQVKAGRQEIALDNQRFVGPVGWRQNWQSFDAASVQSSYLRNLTVFYAYLDHVHRITGDGNRGNGDFNLDNSHLVNVGYKVPAIGTLTGYAYLLGFSRGNVGGAAPTAQRDTIINQSSRTYGLRFNGEYKLGPDWSALYTGEYAEQSDYGTQSRLDYDANYWLVELGGAWRKLALKGGYEVMGGSGAAGDKFNTPLATLHTFDGWADLFLTTPDTGIVDAYLSFGGPLPITIPWLDSFRAGVVYHDFSSDSESIHYGHEFDAQLEYALKKIDPNLLVGIKGASYRADDNQGVAFRGTTQRNLDTHKLWVYTQYSF